jgi:hypothetical protein
MHGGGRKLNGKTEVDLKPLDRTHSGSHRACPNGNATSPQGARQKNLEIHELPKDFGSFK